MVSIIEYEPKYAGNFKALNIAWLEKYFVVEPIDEVMLADPGEYIISKGGHIYFAQLEKEIVGTFALLKIDKTQYELAKMAVDENHQGKKIGNYIMEFALTKARELNASKLSLFSNTKLGPAIHLYEKYGFKEIPLIGAEYLRSNIKMELVL